MVGITGTGGAGKSSLTDELLRRFLMDNPDNRVAILSIDPTRKRSGGALLGDRIRMNSIDPAGCSCAAWPPAAARASCPNHPRGRRRVQGGVVRPGHHRDQRHRAGRRRHRRPRRCESVRDDARVRRPEQLEKIDMLDFADLVAVNKFEQKRAMDALRDVRKQVQRNRERSPSPPRICRSSAPSPPASPTTASPRCTRRCSTPSAARWTSRRPVRLDRHPGSVHRVGADDPPRPRALPGDIAGPCATTTVAVEDQVDARRRRVQRLEATLPRWRTRQQPPFEERLVEARRTVTAIFSGSSTSGRRHARPTAATSSSTPSG